MSVRLQKVIADAGWASRREAERWIAEGKVRVNGKQVDRPGTLVDPESDTIKVGRKTLPPPAKKIYLILNKPPSCITTARDDRDRPTVMEYVKKVETRVFPVGRLDYNTQGALLFTNDGGLAKKLLDPKGEVTKRYLVKVRGIPDEPSLKKLRRGVRLDNKPTAPIEVVVSRVTGKNCFLDMKLVEGKNRHIKRVCEKIGYPVVKLKRTHFAFLSLLGLPLGKHRFLTSKEEKKLQALVT